MDGNHTEMGLNFEKFYSYIYANGIITENQVVGEGKAVAYSVYNTTNNPIIVAYYGEGEEGYANYIRAKMTKYPFPEETSIFATGKDDSSILASKIYTDVDGSTQPYFPAVYLAKTSGVSVPGKYTGFEAGEWWLPSVHEMYHLINARKTDATDLVNVGLTKIGGTNLNNANIGYWTCNEGGGINSTAIYNYGSSGRLTTLSKSISLNGTIPNHARAITSLFNIETLNRIPIITDISVSVNEGTFVVTAKVNPRCSTITPVIYYGLTTDYGDTKNADGGEISSTGIVTFTIPGLLQDTTYHFKIVAGSGQSEDGELENNIDRWVIPVEGRSDVVATPGTLVFTATEDISLSSEGDVVISVVNTNDSTFRRHTVTVNCPNNGEGKIIINDKSKIVSWGNHNGTSNSTIPLYDGTDLTIPKITVSLNDAPVNCEKINQSKQLAALSLTGDSALPINLKFLSLGGARYSYLYTGALPSGITYLRLANVKYIADVKDLPSGLEYLELIGVTNPVFFGNAALPTGITSLKINAGTSNLTEINIGDSGDLTFLNLQDYRIEKMSSTDMVTFLTNLKNRTGALPATITINDYADYALPPSTVEDAVAALKAAKSITTVNLGE